MNESIPEELYQAVSEVFAYIYQVDREHGLKRKSRTIESNTRTKSIFTI